MTIAYILEGHGISKYICLVNGLRLVWKEMEMHCVFSKWMSSIIGSLVAYSPG